MPQTKRRYYGKRKRKELNVFHLLPLLFIIAIVPLIMRGTVVNLTEMEQSVWIGSETRFDIFSYYKSIWFVITTFVALLILLWLHLENYLTIHKAWVYYVPLSIYTLFVFLSWVFSDHTALATRGFIEIFQGVFVLLAYGIIIFIGMNMIRKEEHLVPVAYALLFVGFVTFIIGFSQYFGFDVFRFEAIQQMVLPQRLNALVGNLNFTFGPRTIYATMYNTNFVGSFAALMVPLSFGAFLYFQETNHKVYAGTFFAMMVFVWLGSNSRAGVLGVMAALIIIAVLMHQHVKTQPIIWGISFGIIVVIAVSLNLLSAGRTATRFTTLNPITEADRVSSGRTGFIEAINLDGTRLEIITDQESLVIIYENNMLVFEDLEGNNLVANFAGNQITLVDETYEDFSFILDTSSALLRVRAYNRTFDSFLTTEGFLVSGVGGATNVVQNPPRVQFLDGYEEFASGRGYIWSRSLPMFLDTWFLGHGPDMYVLYFPQRDIAGRMNGFVMNGINDKPHNMFLQIGINTGVISLIALMSVYGIYFFDSIKRYWKLKYETFSEYLGVTLFAGIIGYLVAGIFNDQIISIAPMFYALSGIGIAVNWLVVSTSERNG